MGDDYICRFDFNTDSLVVSILKLELGSNGWKESHLIIAAVFYISECSYYRQNVGEKNVDMIKIIDTRCKSLMILTQDESIALSLSNPITGDILIGYSLLPYSVLEHDRFGMSYYYSDLDESPSLKDYDNLSSKINSVVSKLNSYRFKNQ